MADRFDQAVSRREQRWFRSTRVGLVFALVSMVAMTAAMAPRPTSIGAQTVALATAEIVPADAALYAALNLDTSSEQFQTAERLAENAGILRLFEAIGLTPESMEEFGELFGASVGGEMAIAVTSLAILDDVDVDDVRGALPIGATPDLDDDLGMDMPTTNDGSLGFAVLARGIDPDVTFTTTQGLLVDASAESSEAIESETYEGVTIEFIGADPFVEDATGIAVAQVGDITVISGAPADIYPFIDTAAGALDSVVTTDSFTELRALLSGDFLLYGYINGTGLVDQLDVTDEELAEIGIDQSVLESLDAYTGLLVAADAIAPGFRFDTITIPATPGQSTPGGDIHQTTFDTRVPSETLLFTGGLDLGESPLLVLLAGVLTGALMADDGMMGAATPPPGLDMTGEDLVELLQTLLVGEFAAAISIPGVAALMNPASIFLLLATEVSDPTQVEALLQLVALTVADTAGEGTEFRAEERDGSTIYVAENLDTGFPITLSMGVVDGELVFGFGDSLETFATGPVSSLADNERYQQVMALLPAEHGGVFYLDLAQTLALAQLVASLAGLDGSASVTDASPECANYASQAEAQAAYDEDPFDLSDLDQNFDGVACGDFFTDQATPTPTFAELDLSGLVAFGLVQYATDAYTGASGILLVDDSAT